MREDGKSRPTISIVSLAVVNHSVRESFTTERYLIGRGGSIWRKASVRAAEQFSIRQSKF